MDYYDNNPDFGARAKPRLLKEILDAPLSLTNLMKMDVNSPINLDDNFKCNV